MASCPRCRTPVADPAGACPLCAKLDAPLPEPMTEPVLVFEVVAREPLPPRPALGRPFADSAPVPNRPRTAFTGPTLPAQPGLPMNDVEQPPVHQTIPATDRADHQPTAPAVPTVKPKLVVLRGMRIGAEYPLYEGRNVIGRFADKPVDIDLVSQESLEQIWCSRQHAVLVFEKGAVSLEDLNSLNGTWLNGVRVHAGQPRAVKPGDVVQIGTVQMKLVLG